MKTIYLWSWENDDIFNKFMDYFDNLKEEWQIYINSWWWSTWLFDSILTRLEEVNKEYKVKLRWLFLGSMAFDIFYNYTGEKIIEKWCDAIVHTTAWKYDIFKHNWEIRIRWDKLDKERFWDYELFPAYSFLTDYEKTRFYNWEDIRISESRLREIFS